MKMSKGAVQKAMIRGAKIGAIIGCFVGLGCGITICMTLHVPVPPLVGTEIGTVLGASLGALIGWARTFRMGRQVVRGTLLGLAAALLAGLLLPAGLRLAGSLGLLGLGIFLGHERGLLDPEGVVTSAWAIRRKKT